MEDSKPKSKLFYAGLNMLGTAIAASAFLVYANGVKGYPVAASYVIFMLFSILTMFLIPDRSKSLNPIPTWGRRIRSLKKGGHGLLLTNGVTYFLVFYFILNGIKTDQESVVVTLLVINLCRPLVSTLLGFLILGDKCKNWIAFFAGTLFCIAGIFIYKTKLNQALNIEFFDTVLLIALMMLLFQVLDKIIAGRYRREYDIPIVDAVRSAQLLALIPGLVWLGIETSNSGQLILPNPGQLLALAYLGVMPTAISLVLINRAMDVIGIMVSDVIADMRAIFVLLLGLLAGIGFWPFTWFNTGEACNSPQQIAGVVLAVLGVALVIFFAKGEANTKDGREST